jgi:hypothetical protein
MHLMCKLQNTVTLVEFSFVLRTEMAGIRSTARLIDEGENIEATETAPISEVMKCFGLVVQEGEEVILKNDDAIAEASSDDVEDDGILSPSKPSFIEFGKSTVKAEDLVLMNKLGYFGKNDDELVWLAGDEIVLEPRNDEVVVFKSFFRAGLRFPLYEMISEVLKKFEIYLNQLTQNAIVRLSMYIWALRSQGKSAKAEGFCRVHELHYQTKARADGLHKNFESYNFAYQKDTKAPVIGYRTKWPTGWTNEWFYVKADEKKREKLMSMVMSPLKLSFGMTRPLCNMQLGSPCQLAEVEFRVVAEHISTRDLMQKYLANKTFPTSGGWGMPEKKEEGKNLSLFGCHTGLSFRTHSSTLVSNGWK